MIQFYNFLSSCKYCDEGTVNGIVYEEVDRDLLIQHRDKNSNLTKVCTSLVTNTNMHGKFWDADIFNEDVSRWDVSLVADMRYMYWNASSFDQDLGNWCFRQLELFYSFY